jgi:hypothetical protein
VKFPNKKEQFQLLSSLEEGGVMEFGEVFKFDPDEKLVWRCEEIAAMGPFWRYTFHVFFQEVMLRSVIAMVDRDAGTVVWSDGK